MASVDPASRASKDGPAATPEIARLTHDLNNVFTVIYTALDMVLSSEEPIVDARPVLAEAQSAARRGAQMVTNIRELIGRQPVSFPGKTAPPAHDIIGQTHEGSENILVLSKHVETRLLLRAVLSYRGYRVNEVADTLAAIQSLANKDTDLVIAENEPGMEEALLSACEGIPILLLAPEIPAGKEGHARVEWCQLPLNNTSLAAQVRSILA